MDRPNNGAVVMLLRCSNIVMNAQIAEKENLERPDVTNVRELLYGGVRARPCCKAVNGGMPGFPCGGTHRNPCWRRTRQSAKHTGSTL